MGISENNKFVVRRFNKEVIQEGNLNSFEELMDPSFINHSALGTSNGRDSRWNSFNNILRPAFPDLQIEIHDQVAEDDKVTTRKTIRGTHLGTLMGIKPTNRKVTIDVIDIVRIRNGRYQEHWGINTFSNVVEELRKHD